MFFEITQALTEMSKSKAVGAESSVKLVKFLSELEVLSNQEGSITLINALRLQAQSFIDKKIFSGATAAAEPAEYWLYSLLVGLAQLHPFNSDAHGSWVCPITLQEHAKYNPTAFVLSTGYCYDKAALLGWFNSSQQFTCPVTGTVLPQFDIDRIINPDFEKEIARLSTIHDTEHAAHPDIEQEQAYQEIRARLCKIETLKVNYLKKKNVLLHEQEVYFNSHNLSISDQIKKDFLALSHHLLCVEDDDKLLARLRENISSVYKQQLPKSLASSDVQGNFSNVDLSNLRFDSHKLCAVFASRAGNRLDFRGANLSDSDFLVEGVNSPCLHIDFTEANLDGVRFLNKPGEGSVIRPISFKGANLRNTDLTGINDWRGVNVEAADFSGAYLYTKEGVKLTSARLSRYLEKQEAQGVDIAIFSPDESFHAIHNNNFKHFVSAMPDAVRPTEPNNVLPRPFSVYAAANSLSMWGLQNWPEAKPGPMSAPYMTASYLQQERVPAHSINTAENNNTPLYKKNKSLGNKLKNLFFKAKSSATEKKEKPVSRLKFDF